MAGNLTIDALLALGIDRLRGSRALRGDTAPIGASGAALITDIGPTGASGASVDTATYTLDVELLLAHSLSMSRTQLKVRPESVPNAERAQRFIALIDRRAAGEPVAYILGYRDFWTLRLAVSPAVLVPRPETELLVERALALGPAGPGRVADLGTGSGAIALALASERPEWTLTATDISEDALEIARANASMLGLARVEFLKGRWFEPLAGRRFDLIAGNPPYIAEGDPALQNATLKHEPQTALSAGPDGMLSLREIVHSAPQHLERRGWLLLEHGSTQAAAVARELVVRGFGHVRSHRDLAGHERITEAQWI